jgi:hypothetical protein
MLAPIEATATTKNGRGTLLAALLAASSEKEQAMARNAVCVVFVSALCFALSTDVRAEPIRISGGSLVFTGPSQFQAGPLSLVGNRGFSVDGFVDGGETFVGPLASCMPCPPASTIPVGAHILGSGFGGTVTLDGQTYEGVNGSLSPNQLDVELSGSIFLPPWRDAPVTISAPFGVTGDFHRAIEPSFFFQVPIRGSGRVTLSLEPEPGGTWFLAHTRYDFLATPTPEPASLMLVTAGLVASAVRGARRSRAIQTAPIVRSAVDK